MGFRLVTYNIHKGIGGVDRRYRPDRIINVLHHHDADIVLLQEVTEGVPRSRRHRQVDLLGDALGLGHRAFQRNVTLTHGHYGNAILSRFPLTGVQDLDLSVPLKKRRRALVARFRPPEGRGTSVLLVNCHLGLAGYERMRQLRLILDFPAIHTTRSNQSIIVAGDYNDVWETLGQRLMEPAGFHSATGHARTFPALLPVRPLDHVYFKGALTRTRGFASRIAIAKQASDHLPLVADFEFGS